MYFKEHDGIILVAMHLGLEDWRPIYFTAWGGGSNQGYILYILYIKSYKGLIIGFSIALLI